MCILPILHKLSRCGIEMGENYNKSKKENPEKKQCLKEKEAFIKDALKYYGVIELLIGMCGRTFMRSFVM